MTEDPIANKIDSEVERVRRAEALLARHTNPNKNHDGWIPAWSSYSLEQTVEEILGVDGSETNDLFQGLWNLLTHTQAPLNPTMEDFQFAIVRFPIRRRYRAQLERADFRWMMTALKEGSTAAQAYLTLSILRKEQLADCKDEILDALKDSEYLDEALHTEGLRSPDTLGYGHYQIEPIEVPSGMADGVYYDNNGARLGMIISEVRDDKEHRRVRPLSPYTPAPSNWQELIQKDLEDEE